MKFSALSSAELRAAFLHLVPLLSQGLPGLLGRGQEGWGVGQWGQMAAPEIPTGAEET